MDKTEVIEIIEEVIYKKGYTIYEYASHFYDDDAKSGFRLNIYDDFIDIEFKKFKYPRRDQDVAVEIIRYNGMLGDYETESITLDSGLSYIVSTCVDLNELTETNLVDIITKAINTLINYKF